MGKKFEFLIPSFGLRERCHGCKQSFGTTGYPSIFYEYFTSPGHCKQKVSTQKVRKGILVGKITMLMKLAHGLLDVGYTKSHI